jgi:hypothetical protein
MYAESEGFAVRTLSLPATAVLDLEPREVGGVLLNFGLIPESAICASNPHSKHLAKTLLNCGGCRYGNSVEGVIAAAIQGVLTEGILTAVKLVETAARKVRKSR